MSKRKKPRKPRCEGSNTGKLNPLDATWIKRNLREKNRQKREKEKDKFLREAKEYVARRRTEISKEFRAQRQAVSMPTVSNTSYEVVTENPTLSEKLNAEIEKRGCSMFLLAMSISGLLGLALIIHVFNFLFEFLAR